MPSGRTHDRITLWLLPWIFGLSWLLSRSSTITLLMLSGFLFSGLMFGPDLDIYSVQYQRWGFLRWLWRPYQSFIPHRSWLSHGFLIGTLIRVIYLSLSLFLIAIPVIIFIQLFGRININWQELIVLGWQLLTQKYLQETLSLIIGLELGAMSHSFSDWLGTTYKRRQRKSKKRKKRRSK